MNFKEYFFDSHFKDHQNQKKMDFGFLQYFSKGQMPYFRFQAIPVTCSSFRTHAKQISDPNSLSYSPSLAPIPAQIVSFLDPRKKLYRICYQLV